MKKIWLFAAVLLVAQCTQAQSFDKAKLDAYLQALSVNNKFMGTVSVAHDGNTIYSKAVGFADVEKKIPTSIDSKFRIGSITKMFTTVLVFKAIEENKLMLDDRLSKYFPSVTNAEKITIGNMLDHRSGINNFTNDPTYLSWYQTPQTNDQLLARIVKGGSDFAPDSKANYSNANFLLLGFILEKIYKKPYKTLLNEKIIQPLHLKNTYYGGKIDISHNETYSYKFRDIWIKDGETDMSVPAGAGAIVSNPADLILFIEALFHGKLISSASLEKMKATKDGYGMGMFPMPFNNTQGYGHNGGIDGFSSILAYYPADHLSVGITCNGTNFINNDILLTALKVYFNLPVIIPSFHTLQLTTADLDKYLGTYSSKDMPLKLTITKKGINLVAQATGQRAFSLVAIEKDVFSFDAAGIELSFNPELHKMILKQAGRAYLFVRE